VIPIAARQVTLMQQLWPSLAGTDLRKLILVQVQFADLLGWLHQDIGEYTAARYWLDRALEWAHITTDSDSVAFILAPKAQLAGDMHNPADAIVVAEAAVRHASPGSRISAAAATYAAHGYALAGDRAACDRLCDQARTALDGDGGQPGPWALFMDQPYIDVHQARSHAALGDYRTAATRFRTAINQLQPAYYRDRGVYLAREAAAHARAGEAEHAAALGMQALSIGTETRSGRIFTELAHLEQVLAPARSSPAVTQFLTATDAALPVAPPGRKAGHR
jgi:tetratricopeptide (TPR) repeat protein